MKEFIAARKAGVPIVAIETADPAATMKACAKDLRLVRKNKKGEDGNTKEGEDPRACWDCSRALVGINKEGKDMVATIAEDPLTTLNPSECLGILDKMDYEDAVIFFSNADQFITSESVLQGVWNLRDKFKQQFCMLVLMAPSITLPPALRQDVVVISEELPDAEELEAITKSTLQDADIPLEALNGSMPKVVDTMRGFSAYAGEQAVAMSLTKKGGVDLPQLMKLKRNYVAQMPGAEVREDKITMDDIAGYGAAKLALSRKIAGKRPPRLELWLDEIEKALGNTQGDTSNTSQDQLGTILTWMQDRLNEDRLSAMLLVGFPGCGKSAVAQAMRNAAGCECLRLDMGGMKDSLVGGSEKRIRNVLKMVDAMSGGHIMVIATANSATGLPSPLMSRFAFGTWFFDLPDEAECEAIWKIKRKKYGLLSEEPNPTSAPWTGREIQQCCFLADDLRIPLSEAAKYITPFCATGTAEIESLRRQANKRWLSASNPGFYTMPVKAEPTVARRMSVNE